MDGRCERHQFEAAVGLCDFCGDEFCGECLVRPFGNKKPPLCIPCTIAQSGLRSNGARKRRKLSRKERKEIAEQLASNSSTPNISTADPALIAAAKPIMHRGGDTPEVARPKKGRKGKRKGKGDGEASDDVPKIAAVQPAAPRPAEPEFAPEPPAGGSADTTDVPAGAGMTAPGADEIDWSKPFEVSN